MKIAGVVLAPPRATTHDQRPRPRTVPPTTRACTSEGGDTQAESREPRRLIIEVTMPMYVSLASPGVPPVAQLHTERFELWRDALLGVRLVRHLVKRLASPPHVCHDASALLGVQRAAGAHPVEARAARGAQVGDESTCFGRGRGLGLGLALASGLGGVVGVQLGLGLSLGFGWGRGRGLPLDPESILCKSGAPRGPKAAWARWCSASR